MKTMNKQELIDNAVEDLSGDLRGLCNYGNKGYALLRDTKPYSLAHVDSYAADQLLFFCTQCEFENRARELGWCNGYRYGVEYETNGKKPDLPDDVICKCVHNDGEELLGSYAVRMWDWECLKSFRIVDQRYKPKDQPMFTVGVECEWRPSSPTKANWKRCAIDYIHGDRICVTNAGSFKTKQVLHNVKFRPIKTEREKFVEAAVKAINKSGIEVYSEDTPYFLSLYDAGFKAPD